MIGGLFVELVGAAGVGKSVFCEQLVDRIQRVGISAVQFDDVKIDMSKPKNWLALVGGVALALRFKPRTWFMLRSSAIFIAAYRIRRAVCAQSCMLQIASEGLLQKCRSLHRHRPDRPIQATLDTFLSRLRPPDVIIVVEASAERVYLRRSRRRRPGDTFTHESVRSDVALTEDSALLAQHLASTSEGSRIHVLRARLETDFDESVVDAVAAELIRLWRQRCC